MKRSVCILTALFFIILSEQAQPFDSSLLKYSEKKIATKPFFYFSLGWHRIFYTNSTIHFKDHQTANYDFKLIKAKGIDDNDLNIGHGIDAPQFSIRIGFFFKKNPDNGLELNFDHAKYILKQGQTVHLTGSIDNEFYDQDTLVSPDFIQYEHTDGANYYMLNFIKRKQLLESKNGKHELSLLVKPGAGIVRPRTESTVMGNHINQRYHISGYVAGIESGFQVILFKHILAEITVKGAYANYFDVLLYGKGKASQHWCSFQYLFLIGYQFNRNK